MFHKLPELLGLTPFSAYTHSAQRPISAADEAHTQAYSARCELEKIVAKHKIPYAEYPELQHYQLTQLADAREAEHHAWVKLEAPTEAHALGAANYHQFALKDIRLIRTTKGLTLLGGLSLMGTVISTNYRELFTAGSIICLTGAIAAVQKRTALHRDYSEYQLRNH